MTEATLSAVSLLQQPVQLVSYQVIFLSGVNTCPSNYVLSDFDSKCAIKHPMTS